MKGSQGRDLDELKRAIALEETRQQEVLEMIPSENYASKAVRDALGSVLTNKYSEGYPGKRYYGGNQYIDEIENIAIARAKSLFGAEHANVQPYSGSPANLAIYFALLNFSDKVMGLSLSHGGHLTHGHKVNFSGKAYTFVHYGVDPKTELIDYDEVRKIALREKPKAILSGYTAYPRSVDFKRFAEIAHEVGALSIVDMSHVAGLVAAGLHPSPFPHSDVVMTTTHKTLRGPRGAIIMCKSEFAQKIDKAVFPGMQGGPHNNNTAAKAICLAEATTPSFKQYASQTMKNARALADGLREQELRLVSGGTDNHLVLVDLSSTQCTGAQAESALDAAHITVNKNTIPFDKRSPLDPSGIRMGTPALTTRGMEEQEMHAIASWIGRILKNPADASLRENIRKDVKKLCARFPVE